MRFVSEWLMSKFQYIRINNLLRAQTLMIDVRTQRETGAAGKLGMTYD